MKTRIGKKPSLGNSQDQVIAYEDDEDAAAQYIENCKRYECKIDRSIVLALRTGWSIIQPTKTFSEGSMLPLLGILDQDPRIRKVNLANVGMQDTRYRSAGNGNSNARALVQILAKTSSIEELDLSNTGLDDDGIEEISKGIRLNKTVKVLSLAANHFGEKGASSLAEALKENSTVEKLDLSRNALGFPSIHNVLCSCRPKNIFVVTSGNFVFEEIMNSVSHGVAFLGSVVGANLLISEAMDQYRTDYHFWACVLYSFSLMFLFLSSCLYHSFFMMPTTSRILQVLDHVGIYMLIAGSYTPILLLGLHHVSAARVLVVCEWLAAFFGSIFAMCSDLNAPMTTLVELTLFLSMGCGCLLILDDIMSQVSHQAFILLALGGLCYVLGIAFFILGEYKPIYHVVWHLFVVVAAALHWFTVYFFIVGTDLQLEDSLAKSRVSELVDLVDSMSAAASAAAAGDSTQVTNAAAFATAAVLAMARNITGLSESLGS